MKELIYLDTSILHSFIAQSQGGLPQSTQVERQEQVTETSQNTTGFAARSFTEMQGDTGTLSIPGLVKSPSGRVRVRIQPGRHSSESISLSELESGKEIISKQLHDNALESFEKYLSEQNKLFDLSESNLEGKFIKITEGFKIVDFRYLRKIIQTEALIDFMFMKQTEEVAAASVETNNSSNGKEKAVKKAALNQIQNTLNRQKGLMKSNFEFIEKSLDYLNDILPTESFLLMGNTIAPLKNEFLREKANELMFKYGGLNTNLKITMLGKVTHKIEDTSMPNISSDPFFEFPKILSSVLGSLGIIEEGNLIISPIAIYFE